MVHLVWALVVILVILVTIMISMGLELKERRAAEAAPTPQPQVQVDVDTSAITRALAEQLAHLPEQITQSITGTANTHKGKLGELIGYLQIKAEYDRIIPLGTIVDFMALSFPKNGESGKIVFLDVKTGKNARLNNDQKQLKALIESKNIEFRQINIDSTNLLTGINDD